MLLNHVNEYLSSLGYHLEPAGPVFTEIDSMHFIGLLAHLSQLGVHADLSQFHLPMTASLNEFVSWLEQFVLETA